MRDEVLQASIRAVRTAGDADQPDLASATRARVQRSLVRRARSHRRLVQSSLVVAVLLVSTLSWAVSTGRITLRRSEPSPAIEPAPVEPPKPQPPPANRAAKLTPEVWPPPAASEKPANKVEPSVEKPVAKPRPVPKSERAPTPIEVLYRKAHELHFRGGDHAATLAAWDAYLAAESTGRFAVEARYNRALVLARLGRYADAREALLPFSRGEVASGYRQNEAQQLVGRLEALATGSGE